jgi:hypothetical protein
MTKKNKLINKFDMANDGKSSWRIDMTKKHNIIKDVAMSIEDAPPKKSKYIQERIEMIFNLYEIFNIY